MQEDGARKAQAALDAAELEQHRSAAAALVSKSAILAARVEELEGQVRRAHLAKGEAEERMLLVEAQKGELSATQLAAHDTKTREILSLQARVAELESQGVVLKQRAALADSLQGHVLDLQEKLSAASHELGLARTEAGARADKAAFLQQELAAAHSEAQVSYTLNLKLLTPQHHKPSTLNPTTKRRSLTQTCATPSLNTPPSCLNSYPSTPNNPHPSTLSPQTHAFNPQPSTLALNPKP